MNHLKNFVILMSDDILVCLRWRHGFKSEFWSLCVCVADVKASMNMPQQQGSQPQNGQPPPGQGVYLNPAHPSSITPPHTQVSPPHPNAQPPSHMYSRPNPHNGYIGGGMGGGGGEPPKLNHPPNNVPPQITLSPQMLPYV